jgi:hypothetical protein
VEAVSVEDVKGIRDKAEAFRKYLQASSAALERQNEAAEIKLRAEYRLGQLLSELNLKSIREKNLWRGNVEIGAEAEVSLEELKITKSQSSRYQQIARFEELVLSDYLEASRLRGEEITTAGFLRFARQVERSEKSGKEVCSPCEALVRSGERFGCILVDSTDEHAGSPAGKEALKQIGRLSAPRAHLHVLADDATLGRGAELIRSSHFTLTSSVVWTEHSRGSGRFWPCRNRFLLLGVKGNLPFLTKRERLELTLSASVMPSIEAVRQTLERVSPKPYLHLLSDRHRPNWAAVSVKGD